MLNSRSAQGHHVIERLWSQTDGFLCKMELAVEPADCSVFLFHGSMLSMMYMIYTLLCYL